MNVEELNAEDLMGVIEYQDTAIKRAQEVRVRAMQKYAELTCPFKVGDTATCCGYSYGGRKMEVNRIICKDNSGWGSTKPYIWMVYGRVLKADGTPGKNTAEFDQNNYEKGGSR